VPAAQSRLPCPDHPACLHRAALTAIPTSLGWAGILYQTLPGTPCLRVCRERLDQSIRFALQAFPPLA